MFSGTYCKKRRRKKKHTINYYGKSGDSRTPDPRQGLYTRNCNGRNYSFYHSWRPSWRPLFAENSRASGGSAPWAPRGFAPAPAGPYGGPLDPTRMSARCATRTDFSAHPFFANPGSATVHIPLCSSKSLAPRGVDPGGGGGGWWQSPPPPMKILGGGQTYRFAPSPPPPIISSTWKIYNNYVMQE